MQKSIRVLISSLILAAILFSAIASGRPVNVVRADQPEMDAEVDAFGNVVRNVEAAYNYLQEPSGEFSRVTMDGELNIIGKEILPNNPFLELSGNGESQITELPDAVPLSGEAFLSNEWAYHPLGSGLGASGLNIGDINMDGIVEIVAGDTSAGNFGANDRWFVLQATAPADYVVVFTSQIYSQTILQMVTADIDGNAMSEIYVALADKSLLIYSGTDFRQIGSFSSALTPNSMVISDANGDGTSEIILSDGTGIIAYDITTYQVLWQTSGYGGNLAVGDVDGDSKSEIVSGAGYVLNGGTRQVEWYYPASSGFGKRVAIGDIDGDGICEIVGAAGWYKVTIFKANLKSPMWEIATQHDIAALTLMDINNDQRTDILYGDGQWGNLYGIDGQTQQMFWQIRNPEHGVTRIAAGDTDQDSQLEVLWGAGFTSTGADYLYVANALSATIEWQSADLDGPYSALDTGDVDDDGQDEIVMASDSSNSGYGDGVINIFDATTHVLEWQSKDLPQISTWSGIGSLRIGDVDQDGRTEFVIATAHLYDGLIQIYDGATHTLERQSVSFSGASLSALEIADVDGDSKIEIIAGQLREHTGATGIHVLVFDGETATLEWQSISLDAYWGSEYDIQVADADQDDQVEIIASLRGGSVYVFNGVTHVMEALIPTTANSLAVGDLHQTGRQSILVGLSDGTVAVYNASTYTMEKVISLADHTSIDCLNFVDLDKDRIPEWQVCSSGYLMVYNNDASKRLWKSSYLGASLGKYNQISIGQIDLDRGIEIVVGSVDGLFQFESVEANPLTLSRMRVSDRNAHLGDSLTYTIEINNLRGETYSNASAVNPLPAGVNYLPNSLVASSGSAVYDNGIISWTGVLNAEETITLTYQVVVNDVQMPAVLHNSAQLTAGTFSVVVDAETLIGYMAYLPFCTKACTDFLDTFENSTTGWLINNDTFFLTEYINGEYRLQAKNPQYIYMMMAPTCRRQNYSVEVDARWADVHGDGYGLFFGLDESYTQSYLFVVSSDYQEFALYYQGANGYEAIVNWQYSALIHSNSSNHLMVTRSGDQITLGINGGVLGTWTDGRVSGSTSVGLFIIPYSSTPNADVRYDNFSIRLVPGESLSALETKQSQTTPGLSSPNLNGYLQELLPDLAQTDDWIRH